MNKHHVPIRTTAFNAPDAIPGSLSSGVAASILAAVGDVSLVLDADGGIIDVAVSNAELSGHNLADWIGTPWAETVSIDSKLKVQEMLGDAAKGSAARWRQINHVVANGELPMRYLAVSLGTSGRIVAIGRDMRAAATMQQRLLQTQQSLERDYVRLRQAEARYRLLFDMASEPVLIVDAVSRRIREANPAALKLLELKDGAITDQPVSSVVQQQDRDTFISYLGAAEASDDVAPVLVRLRDEQGEAHISATLFRQARTAMLLVRIAPLRSIDIVPQHDTKLGEIVERMPDAFVLVDRDLAIMTANAAFVELAEMPSEDRVRGARLGAWLGRPGIDLELIISQMREHGSVSNVSTVFRGSGGAQEEIEVSGVIAPGVDGECFGFTIRNVGRRLRSVSAVERELPRSVEQLTELVGRMSLKDIVRESTDLIERLCIEAALAYTSDNRASAAEVLGVSRQSLYSKLHRHGLGNLVGNAD